MISNLLVNKQYGKWNAILAEGENRVVVFATDGLNIFPETLDEWIETIRRIKTSEDIIPLRMDIDITNYCNNDCVMCFSASLRHERLGYIPYIRLVRIFDEFKDRGGKSVRLTGGGECLTHKSFVNIVDYLDGLNLKISIQTNGDNLFQIPIQDIIAEKAHSLRVSVDSSCNESRQSVHRAKNKARTYDNLIENISTVISKSRKLGRENELLPGATFVVLPENYLGVRKFVEDMYVIGVRWIAIRNTVSRDIYKENPQILSFVKDQLKDLSQYQNFTIVGQYNVSYKPSLDFDKCWISYIRPIILADSSLHLCCMTRNNLIPKAEIGFLPDRNKPFRHTLEKNKDRLASFRTSVPNECNICIDPASNIFIDQVQQLLNEDSGYCFHKAKVKLGSEAILSFNQETALHTIELPQELYDLFTEGGFVDLFNEV